MFSAHILHICVLSWSFVYCSVRCLLFVIHEHRQTQEPIMTVCVQNDLQTNCSCGLNSATHTLTDTWNPLTNEITIIISEALTFERL